MYGNMKVEQIVPAIAVEASGPSYSVPSFCRGLVENGIEVGLRVLSQAPQLSGNFKIVSYYGHTFPHP